MGMFSADDDYPAPCGVVSEEKHRTRMEVLRQLRANFDQSLDSIRLKVLKSNQVQEPNIG